MSRSLSILSSLLFKSPISAEDILQKYQTGAEAAANDCAPSFVRFQTDWKANYNWTPAIVQFHPGTSYQFLAPLDVFVILVLQGLGDVDAYGVVPDPMPRLFFPNGIGIRNWFPGTYQPSPGAGGVIYTRGVLIDGPGINSGKGTAYDHHGIWTNGGFELRNTMIRNFGCDGLNVACAITSAGVEILSHASNSDYSLTIGGHVFTVNSGAGTTDAVFTGLKNAINTVYPGCATGGSPWSVEIKTARANTTYTLIVDGTTISYSTPANANIAGRTSRQTVANGLIAAINAVFPGAAAISNFGEIMISPTTAHPAAFTITLSSTNLVLAGLQINNVSGFTAAGTSATLYAANTSNLKIDYAGASNNSSAYRIRVLTCGRDGISFKGGDAGQCDLYKCDIQSCGETHINDNSQIGNVFVASHIAGTAADDSVPIATGFAAESVFLATYVEGNVGCYINQNACIIGGKPAFNIQSICSGNYFAQKTNGTLASNRAIRGSGAGDGNAYSYLGDPSNMVGCFGMGHPSLNNNDLNWNYQITGIGAQGWFEKADGNGASQAFEGDSHHNNVRVGPAHKLFHRGFLYGGGNESNNGFLRFGNPAGVAPIKRMYAVTQDSVDWGVVGEAYQFPTSISSSGVVSSGFSNAHTPQVGQRVWIENVAGNQTGNLLTVGGLSINSIWMVIATTGNGSFTIGDQSGNAVTVVGTMTAGHGIITIARYEGWTGRGITSPANLTAGFYCIGDRLWNSTPTTGQPMGWICTTAGTGAGATWSAMPNL